MKYLLNLILVIVAWGAAAATPRRRVLTCDSVPANSQTIKFRMNAGTPGDVNRTHPASIEPCLNDDAVPMDAFGQFGMIDATGNAVRKIGVADASDATSLMAWGVSVRPYPIQQSTGGMSASFGTGVPPAGEIDLLRNGYIMVALNDSSHTPKKGDPVYIWCAASVGAQILGGVTTTFSAGNTVKLANAVFNGSGDANGNVEVIIGDRRSL